MAYLVKNGQYAQIELNQVAFPRDGRIEVQCALATEATKLPDGVETSTVFSADVPAENGMILVVDNVTRTVRKASAIGGGEKDVLFALNYSSEHLYDERTLGSLRHFRLVPGEFYPRLGYLAVGDKFTTNAIEATEDQLDDLVGETLVPGTTGYWAAKEDGKVVCQVIAKTTMPDGQPALKLQVVKA
jgi:hypothetical protein